MEVPPLKCIIMYNNRKSSSYTLGTKYKTVKWADLECEKASSQLGKETCLEEEE